MTRFAVRPGASNNSVAPLGFTDDITAWDGGAFSSAALGPNGTSTDPTYSFSNDTDTGIYRVSSNQLGLVAGGSRGLTVIGTQSCLLDGNAGVPTLSFINDLDTGLYLNGTDTIGFACGAAAQWNMGPNSFRPASDNTDDLATTALRIKDLYFASALKNGATQIVSATQGAAVADAAGGATVDAEARTAINTLLARLRTHGLIAT